ncbi:hypothetical protein EDC04DRAFT_2724836 [Pisolithus marmoratus]|nr:hypothetical protein EDC04DRAFT_2724836 [Pisolithus marmoratus]
MQYWTHCELYPHKRTFNAALYQELSGLVIHANADLRSRLPPTRLSLPFESAELSKMMDIMRIPLNKSTDPLMCVVARFMCIFSRIHFLNFHGPTMRPLRCRPLNLPSRRPADSICPFLLRILSVFLFCAPLRYVEVLKSVWRAFVGRVIDEWGGFHDLLDISLLAIINSNTTRIQVIGSIVASVLLTGMWREKAENAEGSGKCCYCYHFATYMNEITDTLIGVDHMAIMFSVPFGLLIWSMTSFVVGFLHLIFSSTYPPTLATTAPGIFLVTVLVAWPVWSMVDIWQRVMRNERSVRGWREREASISRISVGTTERGILGTRGRLGSVTGSLGGEGRKTVSFVKTREDVETGLEVGTGFGTESGVQSLQASEDASEP